MENNYASELQSPPAYNIHGNQQKRTDNPIRQVQSTVVRMPENPLVRDHIFWSLINAMYLNCSCLGVIALVYSIQSRDWKLLGGRKRAMDYGSTARSLNIAATVLSILGFIFIIITYNVIKANNLRYMKEKYGM